MKKSSAMEQGLSSSLTVSDGPSRSPTPDTGAGIPIFFKVEERVKKVHFTGHTMADLRALFFSKYKLAGWSMDNIGQLHIKDQTTNIVYELERVEDLYSYAVIEVRGPQLSRDPSGFGYFMLGKRMKLAVAMVGLPARGKSFTARKVSRYLNWLGVPTQVFNVGSYRRKRLGAHQPSDFFDPDNAAGSSARMHMAVAALDDMVNWLDSGGRVAIYDATNSTEQRQKLISQRCSQEGFDLMWVESICDDDDIIEANIRETKLTSPDYEGVDPEAAAADFRNRIGQYKKYYHTIEATNATFVKLFDAGRMVTSNNIKSYLQSKIVFFLSNLHTRARRIWLSRHGESEFNREERIGGDSNLTDAGAEYSRKLADWVMEQAATEDQPVIVWTSTLQRTIETAQYIPTAKVHLRALDEIDAGEFDGMTYGEIEELHPEEFRLRSYDKLNYRYPRGESYNDVIARLEPVIFELERTRNPVLIIAHQAVQRCLYAYLMNREPSEVPFIPIPLNQVIQVEPRAYGAQETRFNIMQHEHNDSS